MAERPRGAEALLGEGVANQPGAGLVIKPQAEAGGPFQQLVLPAYRKFPRLKCPSLSQKKKLHRFMRGEWSTRNWTCGRGRVQEAKKTLKSHVHRLISSWTCSPGPHVDHSWHQEPGGQRSLCTQRSQTWRGVSMPKAKPLATSWRANINQGPPTTTLEVVLYSISYPHALCIWPRAPFVLCALGNGICLEKVSKPFTNQAS